MPEDWEFKKSPEAYNLMERINYRGKMHYEDPLQFLKYKYKDNHKTKQKISIETLHHASVRNGLIFTISIYEEEKT